MPISKNCSNDSFSDPNTFNNLGLANYICPQNGTFILEGGFDERSVKALVIMISYCDNRTDGVICKSQQEINTFFKDKGLWLYYQDDIYDISNYDKPLMKNWRLQAIQVAAVPRIIDLYLKKMIFINDDNFIFWEDKYQFGFMKERSEGLSDYVMIDSPLISINLFSSKNNQRTRRQYQKFGDLLANIGGVINVLIIFGYILTNLQNQLQMQNHIMNTLYSYSYGKKQKLPRTKNRITLIKNEKKNDPGFHDWNKDFDEMLSQDAFIPPINTQMNLKEDNNPQMTDNNTNSYLQTQKNDSEGVSSKNIGLSSPLTFEIHSPQLPESITEENITIKKNGIIKSHFYLNFKPSDLFIEHKPKYSYEKSIIPISPVQKRSLSPEIMPKALYFIGKQHNKLNDDCKNEAESKPVFLSLSEYLRMKVKKVFKIGLNTKEKLFHISQKKFRKETDICYILQKIQEFEKFKMIMLNPNQIALFNLLAKPLIYLESEKEQYRRKSSYLIANSLNLGEFSRNDSKKRISEMKSFYRKMVDDPNLSIIDQNLLKLMEDDIFLKD